MINGQITTMPDRRSRYRFKQWQESVPEPAAWDIEGFEVDDDPSGSLCLVPHNPNVTLHTVSIEKITAPTK
ncbi:MAG: hypothetical protein HN558_07145 [Gemmatimonadetes bacterium]|nr:hypothetical protein [Gemmatimonadota bacterium]